jgi:enoyl-CoA hydratase/carnithine racemase
VTLETVRPGIALVTMRREAKLNSFNDELISSLTAICESLHNDTAIKAVVLTGGTRVFSAGADRALFDTLEADADVNRLRRILARGKWMCERWDALPMMTIAAVEGGAVGGGLSLALACDWRVFASNAWAMVPEVRIGVNFGWGTLPRLAALAGPARAKWLSILCRKTPAAELAAWRVVEEVSEPGQALHGALRIAEELTALPALPPQLIKRTVNAFSHAAANVSSYGDMEEMLVCLSDEESAATRRHAMATASLKNRA